MPSDRAPGTSTAGLVAGCALGLASGWNLANVGAAAGELARSYGVTLATVGLFTTAMLATHMAVQIPGGRAGDRFGPARAGAAGLTAIALGNLLLLIAPHPALAIGARAVTGAGTGLSFIAGSSLVRESGGSTFAQGVFGGIAVGAGGAALGIVPQLTGSLGWRAPYWTALGLALAVLAWLLATGQATRAHAAARRPLPAVPARSLALVRDGQLYRLAAALSASYGLSIVLGNWVNEFVRRHADVTDGAAAVIGATTLFLAILSRPLGGWLVRRFPAQARVTVGGSIATAAAGVGLLMLGGAPWAYALGGVLVGLGTGMPFAAVFTGAALAKPSAPGASVGFVNTIANLVIVVGTPLVGLTFALPGDGRIGFAAIALLMALALVLLPDRRVLGGPVPGGGRAAAAPA